MANSGVRGLLALASLIAVVFAIALVVGVLEIAIANVNSSLVTSAGSKSTAVTNFNTVVAVIQIVLPFIGVIAIVVAAKVILDVFGFGNIFALGKKGGGE